VAEFNDIQTALDSHLKTYHDANSDDFSIAWPNSNTDEYTSETVRPSFLPGDTNQVSLGATGQDETNGIYQIDIFTKKGEGRSQIIDIIADLYKRGQVLTSGAANVRLRGPSIGGSRYEGNWFVTPITINWQVYTEAR